MEVIEQRKDIIINSNGFIEVTPDPVGEGVAALERVGVTTNVPSAYPATLNVTENGTYSPQDGSMYNSVIVNVLSVNNQDKTVTENGVVTADDGFSGLGTVTVNVTPSEEEIAEYKAEGAEEQKAKLIEVSISSNGTYEREDGYSVVIVDVEPTEEQKDEYRAEGAAEQKAKLSPISITSNGIYETEDGYSEVTVEVEPTEEQKNEYREEGKASQLVTDKSAVAAASPIISNGTKTILDTQVVVNVPSDPAELAEKYTEGEISGKAAQLQEDQDSVVESFPIVTNGTKTILGKEVSVSVPSDPNELQAKYNEGESAGKTAGKSEQLSADKAIVAAIPTITANGNIDILGETVTVSVPDSLEKTYVCSELVEITRNGETEVEASQPAGYDRFYINKVKIKTNVAPKLEEKFIQANGSYTCSEGYDGFGKVIIDVNGEPKLEEKSVTVNKNGKISIIPDTTYSGMSKVTVITDVAPSEDEIETYKAEQADEDIAVINAIPTIEYNGVKVVEINGKLASFRVDVPKGVTDSIYVPDKTTFTVSEKWDMSRKYSFDLTDWYNTSGTLFTNTNSSYKPTIGDVVIKNNNAVTILNGYFNTIGNIKGAETASSPVTISGAKSIGNIELNSSSSVSITNLTESVGNISCSALNATSGTSEAVFGDITSNSYVKLTAKQAGNISAKISFSSSYTLTAKKVGDITTTGGYTYLKVDEMGTLINNASTLTWGTNTTTVKMNKFKDIYSRTSSGSTATFTFTALTDFNGFEFATPPTWLSVLDISKSTKLSDNSLHYIVESLPYVGDSVQRKLKVGVLQYYKINSEDKNAARAKGWNVLTS